MVFEKMNKKVIYTALFGDYDELKNPTQFDGWDYVCFTDQKNLYSDIWKIVFVENNSYPQNMMNRLYKWLPHAFLQEYDFSLYLDTNIILYKNPDYFINKYFQNDTLLAVPFHPTNCIYQESISCVRLGKSNLDDTLSQINSYYKDGFPEKFGLSENSIIFRWHNNLEVINLMKKVWENINNYNTKRDQLALMYEIWKKDFTKYTLIEERIENHDYFRRVTHKYKLKRSILERFRGNIKKIQNKNKAKKYKYILAKLN